MPVPQAGVLWGIRCLRAWMRSSRHGQTGVELARSGAAASSSPASRGCAVSNGFPAAEYLDWVFGRLAATTNQDDCDSLLPVNWAPAKEVSRNRPAPPVGHRSALTSASPA